MAANIQAHSLFMVNLRGNVRYFSGFQLVTSTYVLSLLEVCLREDHLRNKSCSPCLHSLVKTEVNVWENSRADQRKSGVSKSQLRTFYQKGQKDNSGYKTVWKP